MPAAADMSLHQLLQRFGGCTGPEAGVGQVTGTGRCCLPCQLYKSPRWRQPLCAEQRRYRADAHSSAAAVPRRVQYYTAAPLKQKPFAHGLANAWAFQRQEKHMEKASRARETEERLNQHYHNARNEELLILLYLHLLRQSNRYLGWAARNSSLGLFFSGFQCPPAANQSFPNILR